MNTVDMNTVELISVVLGGLAAIVGVSAAIYVCLPASLLNSAGRHGRYAGLGRSVPRGRTPRGSAVANVDMSLGAPRP